MWEKISLTVRGGKRLLTKKRSLKKKKMKRKEEGTERRADRTQEKEGFKEKLIRNQPVD